MGHGILKAVRFLGTVAGAPIGAIQGIRSGSGRVFGRLNRAKSHERIFQLETRLAELEQRICELSDKALPLSEVVTRTTERTRVIDGLVDAERHVIDTIFRHNLKLQKPKMIKQY